MIKHFDKYLRKVYSNEVPIQNRVRKKFTKTLHVNILSLIFQKVWMENILHLGSQDRLEELEFLALEVRADDIIELSF